MKQLLTIVLLLTSACSFAQLKKIKPDEAAGHIGDSLQVCGKVYGGVYLARTESKLTLLNVGDVYPNAPFTIVIPSSVRNGMHGNPEDTFKDASVCATGKVELFKHKPQIVLAKPELLVLEQ